MSAETLREAAALMRKRAEAAAECFAQITESVTVRFPTGVDTRPAEHYFSWNPAAALAVADLLDQSAFWMEGGSEPDDLALAVARAYLGSDQ